MHLDFATLWTLFQPAIVGALGGFILHALHTPKDHERAQQLGTIAGDIAVLVVAEAGGAPWATMLKSVIDQLKAYNLTANTDVLDQVAQAALIRAGAKKPV
jgi:hypothetical protein